MLLSCKEAPRTYAVADRIAAVVLRDGLELVPERLEELVPEPLGARERVAQPAHEPLVRPVVAHLSLEKRSSKVISKVKSH